MEKRCRWYERYDMNKLLKKDFFNDFFFLYNHICFWEVVFFIVCSQRVPGALSLNAAIFASVCLASRLHTTWHAFATVTFSFKLFALWPVLRRRLQVLWLQNVGTLVLGYMLVGSILHLQLTPAHIFVGSGGNAAY